MAGCVVKSCLLFDFSSTCLSKAKPQSSSEIWETGIRDATCLIISLFSSMPFLGRWSLLGSFKVPLCMTLRVPLLLEHWIKICTPIACSCYTLRMLRGIIASVSLWVSRDGKCRTPVSTYGHVHTGAPAQRVCFSLPCSCSSQDSLRPSGLRRFRCYMIIITYIYVFISYSYKSS